MAETRRLLRPHTSYRLVLKTPLAKQLCNVALGMANALAKLGLAVQNRLPPDQGKQAAALAFEILAGLHRALEADKAAAADYRVPPEFKKTRCPYHLEAVVAHPSAAAVIRFLADLDEVGLKWDWRHHREAASGFNVWYVDKTDLWAAAIAGFTKTVKIYWQPFRPQETPRTTPARPDGPQISGENKMKEESYV